MRSQKWTRVFGLALFFCLAAAAGAQPRIDFSYAGYGGGGVSAPTVPAAISVRPTGGDDTELLQQAINHLSALPVRENGFRGALLLRPGRYRVAGHLEMRTGGVVLRGSGNATIVASGTGRRTLIEIGGVAEAATGLLTTTVKFCKALCSLWPTLQFLTILPARICNARRMHAVRPLWQSAMPRHLHASVGVGKP